MVAAQPSSFRPAGTLDTATALAPYRGHWNMRLAAHLLRRAGFGGTTEQVGRLAALDVGAAVASLVNFADTRGLPNGPTLSGPPNYMGMRPDRETIKADRKAHVAQVRDLQQWWLNRMIATPAPLQEKMTLFLHGHFTTTAIQKGVSPLEVGQQNDLFRRYALGNFHSLTLAVSQDPAMLKYLDNARSNRDHPNENYARELMEIYTLGIGNYTEGDVRESARAFTGFQVQRGRGFVFNQRDHDDGRKTFLGQSGTFDGNDIVNIIFQQPAAATYLSTKLLAYFVYSDPEPELVAQFADVIRKNRFELKPSLTTLFASNVFFSERAYRALVKSPVEFVIGAHQTFGFTNIEPETLPSLRRMGQVLFSPPNVKGWDGGAAWLNSETLLTRENFASALSANPKMAQATWIGGATMMSASGMDPRATANRLTDAILLGDVSAASTARLVSYLNGADQSALSGLSVENFDERVRGAAYLTMAMPAYQLN